MPRSLLWPVTAIALFVVGQSCGSISIVPGADGGGHGGTTGAGGGQGGAAGGGGAGGNGGHGGGHADAGNETCNQLVNDYANALTAARACTPSATNQCQTLVDVVLSSCAGCKGYVNDASQLNAIRMQWMNQGCLQTAILCPAIACVVPGPAKCIASDGGPGSCTSSPPVPAN